MEYSKLVAVTGLPGLYELINSKTDGAIVRSLDDNSTRFASSRIHNFSHLESIEVFTTGDNVNLVEIFHAMEKAGAAAAPDTKDNTVVKKYFEKTYPELDFERVYPSDLKKMIKWFEVLKKNNIEIKLSEPPVEEEQPEEALVKEEPKEKPAKKEAAKKEEVKEEKPKKKEVKAEEKPAKKESKAKAEEEKPVKKTAAKKEEEAPKKKPAAKPAKPKGGKK
jgi:outer membrane biosynthesis protein TonB